MILPGHGADVGPAVALDLGLVTHAADREAEELPAQRPRNGLAHGGLADAGRADQADDGALRILLELAHGKVLDDPFLHVLQAVVILVEDVHGLLDIEGFHRVVVPRKGNDGFQVVARDGELGRVGLHERKLLQLLVDLLLDLAGEGELFHGVLEPLHVGSLGIHRHAEFGLDGLHLLLEEILPLALGDLLAELLLDLLLDLQELLLLLDEDEHVLHARLHVGHLEDLLLLRAVDVEDGGDEVGDLPRVIDVHHGQAHLFREEVVVLRDLLHLADERARERLHLGCIDVRVLQVLRHDADGRGLIQHALDQEALQRGDIDVDPAVRQVDAADDLCRRADGEEVIGARVFVVVGLRQDQADEAVRRDGLLHGIGLPRRGEHHGCEDAGEDRLSAQGNDEQPCGQYLVRRHNVMIAHAFRSAVFLKVRNHSRAVKSAAYSLASARRPEGLAWPQAPRPGRWPSPSGRRVVMHRPSPL